MMTEEAKRARAEELLAEEAKTPLAWWWLSFCDAGRPEGSQFLGACLVKAHGFFGATLVARAAGVTERDEVDGVV